MALTPAQILNPVGKRCPYTDRMLSLVYKKCGQTNADGTSSHVPSSHWRCNIGERSTTTKILLRCARRSVRQERCSEMRMSNRFVGVINGTNSSKQAHAAGINTLSRSVVGDVSHISKVCPPWLTINSSRSMPMV
jgi:hypothetical protein